MKHAAAKAGFIVAIVYTIGALALAMTPPSKPSSVKLSNIHTDASRKWDVKPGKDRCNFVEMVPPNYPTTNADNTILR